MTDPEATVARTRVERYRWLCSDANPTAAEWRAFMHTLATGDPHPPPPAIAVDYGDGDTKPCGGCP